MPQSPGEAVPEGAVRRKEGEATLSKEREKKFDMRDILLLKPRECISKICPSKNPIEGQQQKPFFTTGPFRGHRVHRVRQRHFFRIFSSFKLFLCPLWPPKGACGENFS
jgi:hypothetical protein